MRMGACKSGEREVVVAEVKFLLPWKAADLEVETASADDGSFLEAAGQRTSGLGTIQRRSGVRPACCGTRVYDARFNSCCAGRIC